MLALSRREGEWIDFIVPPSSHERRISVQIVEQCNHHGNVSLGFEADKDINIVRRELLEDGKPAARLEESD